MRHTAITSIIEAHCYVYVIVTDTVTNKVDAALWTCVIFT